VTFTSKNSLIFDLACRQANSGGKSSQTEATKLSTRKAYAFVLTMMRIVIAIGIAEMS